MKILACSDIHLGRIPSLPGNERSMTASSAWEAVVSTARAEKVDIIAIAGDIVNQDDAWFEAFGPLLRELKKLSEEGISVVAVAGNHDAKVFPSLLKESLETQLLGQHATWSSHDIKGVRCIGWSFPKGTYSNDPFDTFDDTLLDFDGPILGLLHCDVDGKVGASRYAPVPAQRLEGKENVFWVLGHIHASQLSSNHLYCGSPFALDSSEKGAHGVWLLENDCALWKPPRFIELCEYRFEACEVPLDLQSSGESLRTSIQKAARNRAEELESEGFSGKLYLRLSFTGVVSKEFEVNKAITADDLEAWDLLSVGKIEISPLRTYDDFTEIALDLEELARGSGPKALLAAKLLDPVSLEELTKEAGFLIEESLSSRTFSLVDKLEQDDVREDATEIVNKAAMSLLRNMVNQGE